LLVRPRCAVGEGWATGAGRTRLPRSVSRAVAAWLRYGKSTGPTFELPAIPDPPAVVLPMPKVPSVGQGAQGPSRRPRSELKVGWRCCSRIEAPGFGPIRQPVPREGGGRRRRRREEGEETTRIDSRARSLDNDCTALQNPEHQRRRQEKKRAARGRVGGKARRGRLMTIPFGEID
jgi:hypothetical protein